MDKQILLKEKIMEKFCEYLNKDGSCSAKTNLTTIFMCYYKREHISKLTNYNRGKIVISNMPGSAFDEGICKDFEATEEIHKYFQQFDIKKESLLSKILSWNTKEHKDIEKEIHYKEQPFNCCRNCTHHDIMKEELICNKIFGIFSEVKFPVEYNGICDYYKEKD